MMLMTEAGIMAEADARVFGLLMSANRTARRMMAADRTIAGAYARVATLRRKQEAKASRDHARADRELVRELGASVAPGWGRTFVVRMPGSPPATFQSASATLRAAARASTTVRAIRAYTTPLRDTRGRVALYMDIKYRGLKSKGWRPGLSADHIGYILRELALEMAEAQLGRPISNMGETAEEIIACWRALEEVEAGYRANAKVQYRIVWNLPHELDADQRRALVEGFCERTFGRLGLPYVAAIHDPDAKGDRRNHHAHICFSTRPCERSGDHEWAIAEEKVNGLTDKPGLRLVRALAAAHMNRACRAAGSTTLFTHQTYAERGIDAERQAHVGPEAMAAHDRGEAVGVISHNAAIVQRNELAVERQQVERQLDATQHLERLLAEADGMAERRSVVRAGRDAADALLDAAKAFARAVVRSARSGNYLSIRAFELRARAMRVQRRLPVPERRVVARAAVAQVLSLTPQIGRRASARSERLASTTLAAVPRLIGGARAIRAASAVTSPSGNRTASARVERAGNIVRVSARVVADSRSHAATLISASQAHADLRAIEPRLVDRRAADRQRRHDEAERRRDADLQRERDADVARQRAARIEEACRILLDTPVRPYRRNGRTLHLDLAPLTAIERDLVGSVGIGDPSLRDALIARAKSDAQADAASNPEAAPAPSAAQQPPADAIAVPEADDGKRINTALSALRDRDEWVRQDADGLFTFSEAALQAAGLNPADVITPAVQHEIEAIGFGQVDRLDPVITDMSGRPPFIINEDTIKLDPRFPADLRNDVTRWSAEPQFRALVAKLWPQLGIDRPSQSARDNASKATAQRCVNMAKQVADTDTDPQRDVQVEKGDRVDPGVNRPVRRFHPGMIPGGGGMGS